MDRISFTDAFLKKAQLTLDPDTAGGIKRQNSVIAGSVFLGSPIGKERHDAEVGAKEAMHPVAKGALIGAPIGAGLGYFNRVPEYTLQHVAKHQGIPTSGPEYAKFKKRQRRIRTAAGAVAGAGYGGFIGHSLHKQKEFQNAWDEAYRQYSRSGGHSRSSSRGVSASELWKKLNLSGKEKTKAEVTKKFRDMARVHHPDLGGNPEKMKEVNSAMEELRQSNWFNKLAKQLSPEDHFFQGFLKKAVDWGHAAEVAGLGALAIPSVQHLRNKPMKEESQRKLELAGLGTLAAPSLYHLGKNIFRKG